MHHPAAGATRRCPVQPSTPLGPDQVNVLLPAAGKILHCFPIQFFPMELPDRPSVRSIFSSLLRATKQDLSSIISNPSSFSLPPIPLPDALDLCQFATSVFRRESNLLELTGNFFIIGDLHGHILELIRVLSDFGFPPSISYLFLGDLVDRGNYSTATALYVIALKCAFPESVFVIRGNHEFESVNAASGLLSEITEEYESADLFHAMNVTFAHLPIAARINGEVFCVHGGIGPQLRSVEQIAAIPKPLFALSGGLADALLWSDPWENGMGFRESSRGLGFDFGERVLSAFLEANGLRVLIRGHQGIMEGVRSELGGKCMTVFTISSYCERADGQAGVLQIRATEHTEIPHILPWIPCVPRKMERPKGTKKALNTDVKTGGAPQMPSMVMIAAMRGRRSGRTVVPGRLNSTRR
jgi:protein phosphatase